MTLDWNSGSLAKGLACYQTGEFFAAHEHWECDWLTLEEPQKSFLQAVIQVAAAIHHLQRENPAGTRSLLRRALRKLNDTPADCAGLRVPLLCEDVRACLRSLEDGAQPLSLNPPRICPISPTDDPAA